MGQKPIKESQTQFAQTEPILEEVVSHEDETIVLAQRAKQKKRRVVLGGLGGLLLILYIFIRLLPSPTPPHIAVPDPIPTPSPVPLDTTLLGRIQRARANIEAIDFFQADLSFPQIEKEIYLDPPDPETVPR